MRRRKRTFLDTIGRAACTPQLEQALGLQHLAEEKVEGLDTPVYVHVHSRRYRLLDEDNISEKAIIDGIVAAGLLPSDSPQYIHHIYHTQKKIPKAETEKTIISIYKAEL